MDEAGMKVFTDAMEPGIISSAPISVSQVSRQSSLPLGCILPRSFVGSSAPSSALTFPSTVTATVNLDAQSSGVDVFPYATGTLTITGQRTAFNPLGSASYTITMTTSSTVACTDPASGWTASVPSGTSRTMNLNVTWSGVGPLQNTMTLSATGAQTAHPLTLTKGATTLRGYVISENWTGGFTRTRNVTVVTYGNLSFTGTRIVEWTNSSNATVRVTWDVRSLNEIYLTVVTALYTKTYGPYTALQIRSQFGTTIE